MKLLIIYNPQAGAGRGKKLLPDITQYLEEKGLQAEIKLTSYIGHGVELATTTDFSSYDAIVASGGDGTLFEVLNGYYQNPSKDKPPIGLIPNGTGNAFIRELDLFKTDWKKAIDIIAQNHQKAIDVGRLTTNKDSYYFLNIVGLGFISDIAQAAVPLKWMGNAAYTVAILQKLINLKAKNMTLEVDGKRFERDAVFAEVANSSYTGTSFLIAPKAKIDDGLLDLILLTKLSRTKLLRLFNCIYDGSHINYPEVEYFQAKKIKIIEEQPGKLIPDGEILAESPVEFECIAGDIKFLWDAAKD